MTDDFPPGFQWLEKKNQTNIADHGIDFRDAVRVFEKPTFDRVDSRKNYREVRVNSLGELDREVILNVTHTDRDGDTRLISARLANKRERKIYREFLRELEQERGQAERDPFKILTEIGQKKREAEPQREPEPDQERSLWPDYSQGRERKPPKI